MENNNLPVMVCSQPPVISEHLRDWHAQIAAVEDAVAQAPKDRGGLTKVKAIRAGLRKQFEQMEDQRKAVKAAVLAPYEAANRAYQSQVAEPMRKADETCKRFVDDVSDRLKSRCLEELKEYFAELVTQANLPWLTFDRCGVKVDMATAQKKDFAKERQQIYAFVQRITSEMRTISAMEDGRDLMPHYIRTLDLAQSVEAMQKQRQEERIVSRLLDQAKADAQAQADHLRDLRRADPDAPIPQEKTFSVTFTVTATVPMLRGLRAWLDSNHYSWEET